jgi:hypothetical protein
VWKDQEWALDLMYNAMDKLLLNGTLWNYTASNRNDPRIGDGWNQEDLSVYSVDQRDDPADINSGARAIHGFVRPFPRLVQGIPSRVEFRAKPGSFTLEYQANPQVPEPTTIFVPRIRYPEGYEIEARGLAIDRDEANQLVSVKASAPGTYTVAITRKKK